MSQLKSLKVSVRSLARTITIKYKLVLWAHESLIKVFKRYPMMLYCLNRKCDYNKKEVQKELDINGETWCLLSCGHWLRFEV